MTAKYGFLLFSRSVPSPNMCICVYYVIGVFCCLCLFCVVQRKKKERRESSWTNHGEGEDGRNQCFIFAFLLSSIKGK